MKKAKSFLAILLALFMSLSCFSLVSFAEETATQEHLTEVPEGYIGIYTKDDLLKVHYDATANYILMNDIIFSHLDFGESYNDGNGWIPFPQFSGIFDGNNYKISNIRISGDFGDAGLFSSITSSSIVKNLFVENINISVTGNKVGGVTGSIVFNTETSNYVISNCKVSGNISGGKYVSGICGYAYVPSFHRLFILTGCCNAASVSGISSIGGVLGFHGGGASYEGYIGSRGSNAYIYKCINAGNVCAEGNAGGLVGYTNEGYASGTYGGTEYGRIDINCSFNCGNVTAIKQCGGIIGGLSARENHQITISNCYNVGKITSSANESFGAIIGMNKGNINNTYYVSKSVTEPTTIVGTSLTSDQLKLKNMGSDWTLEGREDYPYPELVGVPFLFPNDVTHIHNYSSTVIKEATHLITGVITYNCDCGDTYTEVIAKTSEHSYSAVVTAPTCTDEGYTTYTCECGDSYVGDYVDALGHTPANAVEENYIAPTCTENGSKEVVIYCSVCDEELSRETENVDATGHADNDGNGYCDDCEELLDPSVECECNCHKSGITKFFFNFILFFQRLFGSNRECACGVAHY